ncbi:sensor domain-containing diguanylate cyclase [Sulfurimonas indica]|uniref:sensor domain-containing diguanylate cyclase n=1 Tax=Sulfurimonas indica TaxID=2508707 RepID=UPI0012656C18|nr:sensor domain-containing diguanylate cyclase [Sulfurimonas indica]
MKNTQSCLELVEESEEKFRKIAENSLVGMFIYTEYFVYVNEAFAKMTGYTTQELLKMHPWELVDESNKQSFQTIIQRRLQGEEFTSVHNEALLVKKDNTTLDVKVSAETIHYRGKYAGIGIIIDITDIVKKNQIIKVLIQALSQSDDIIFITDIKGTIEYVNRALLEIYGYTREEIVGGTPRIFSSGQHEKSFYKELWDTVQREKNYHQIIINKKKNGNLIHVDTKITPVKDERGENISYFAVSARDITERILNEQKFKKLATIDPLTQIPNRYQLYQYFDDFIAKTEHRKNFFSILLFDIDHFKQINDNFGHYVGDNILKDFSRLIVENIRSIDKFGRWGGEEFLLLLDSTDEHDAMRIAQKLNDLVAGSVFDELYCITVSIGVTEYRQGDTKEQCIERADIALYAAKNLGRNRVVFN